MKHPQKLNFPSRLYLSEGTVHNYVSAAFVKPGVTDRPAAAVLAPRAGAGRALIPAAVFRHLPRL